MAVGSHVRFRVSNIRPRMKCNCGSQLGLQMWSLSDLKFEKYYNKILALCFEIFLPIHIVVSVAHVQKESRVHLFTVWKLPTYLYSWG